ncbi:MAG: hypothetical protein EXR71_03035 [Myxococcales bacterium]|nr:hypothetical protein [Myxococcales bacterium]
MLGLSLALAVSALIAGAHTGLPDAAPRYLSQRFGRDRAGLLTFGLGTLAAAAGLLHINGPDSAWGPGAVVLAGWLALRVGTRASRPRRLLVVGTACNLAAIALAAAWMGSR